MLVDDNDGTLTKYVNGPGIDNKLSVQTGSSKNYFLADHLGSTNGLADNSGNLTSSASYDSYGNATGNLNTRYQFTGREYDSFSKLHYYRARFYDGKLGRFISEDPIGFGGGDVNLYGYVWNSPQAFTDPMGLDGWGNDFADWGDERVEYARDWWKKPPENWIWNGTVDTGADLASGFCDMFRVGSGLGYAIYAEDENGYGRAAYIAMDVGRGAGLASLMLGATAPKFSSSPNTFFPNKGLGTNPFKGKTPQELDNMFRNKGFQPKGPDPMNGRGTYVNPKNGRGYHIDANHPPPKGPHVGVHRPRGKRQNMNPRDYKLN